MSGHTLVTLLVASGLICLLVSGSFSGLIGIAIALALFYGKSGAKGR